MLLIPGCSLYQAPLVTRLLSLPGCSCYQAGLVTSTALFECCLGMRLVMVKLFSRGNSVYREFSDLFLAYQLTPVFSTLDVLSSDIWVVFHNKVFIKMKMIISYGDEESGRQPSVDTSGLQSTITETTSPSPKPRHHHRNHVTITCCCQVAMLRVTVECYYKIELQQHITNLVLLKRIVNNVI